MKLFKTFIWTLIILSLIFFLMLNTARVHLNLIFTEFNSAPVNMIIFGSIAIGILFGYLIAIFSILSNKSEIRNLRNQNKILTDELNDLRNVAVDEGIYDSDDEGY
tara:strand:- start:614 stop:931 length:318 start_codon:yes stop_codon:yes gene_type:complete